MRAWMLIAITACGSGDPATDAPGGTPGVDAAASADARGGVGEPAELAGITLAHNQVRAMVTTANALPSLAWDASLAATAAAYVATCPDSDGDGLVDHNDNRSVGHPFYVGENIYASSGTANAAGAVTAWADERAHYHDDANTCDAGQACGHYTQVVWRATEKLGCALHACPGLKYPSTIVCDYGPGGNIGGQKPY
ncbi:MAG: CAP domain-containing protein [Kofleriaceae bacterium]